MNKLTLFNVLFMAFALSGMAYAMEGEKKETPKEQEFISELFAELPLELKQEIIISAAKTGELQEAVENIKNLTLVNKEFNEFINSQVGTKLILNGLMENEDIQNFFNSVLKLAQAVKDWSGIGTSQEFFLEFFGDKKNENNQRGFLAAMLGTKRAQEYFKKWRETSEDTWNTSPLLAAYLGSLLKAAKEEKVPLLNESLHQSIQYMIDRLDRTFAVIRAEEAKEEPIAADDTENDA